MREDPISKKGDKITLIARMSLIIVVSACPMDLNPVGGKGITDLEIIVADTEEEIWCKAQRDAPTEG